jgi:hypothetical protein
MAVSNALSDEKSFIWQHWPYVKVNAVVLGQQLTRQTRCPWWQKPVECQTTILLYFLANQPKNILLSVCVVDATPCQMRYPGQTNKLILITVEVHHNKEMSAFIYLFVVGVIIVEHVTADEHVVFAENFLQFRNEWYPK